MGRYLLTAIFTLAVIALYHFVNIRLFSLDYTKKTKEALFRLRAEPEYDTSIVILNIGKLNPTQVKEKIDLLLLYNPKVVGVNLCHFDQRFPEIKQHFISNKKIIFANCDDNGANGSLSQIIANGNCVTHFKSLRNNYFEFQLTNFRGRGNETELINYGSAQNQYYKAELSGSEWSSYPVELKGKTVLIGFIGDYLTDSIYDFTNCRITPLNRYYNQVDISPDMYDTDISANIISTINNQKFINEISQVWRGLILLTFSIINVLLLTHIENKRTLINLLIATIQFILLTGIAGFLLVYLFSKGWFLDLDELPIILLITTVFTVLLNMVKKGPAHNKVYET